MEPAQGRKDRKCSSWVGCEDGLFFGVKEPNEIHGAREKMASKQQGEGKQANKQKAEEQQQHQGSQGAVGSNTGCDGDAMMGKMMTDEKTGRNMVHPGHLGDLGRDDTTAKVPQLDPSQGQNDS